MELKDFPTNDEWSQDDWEHCFNKADDWEAPAVFRSLPDGEETDAIGAGEVAEVVAWHGCKMTGYSGDDPRRLYALIKLTDGRWAGLNVWTDSNCCDCYKTCEWGIADDRETAWNYGLSQEARTLLKDQLHG